PVRVGLDLRGWVQVEAPPDTGRLQLTRKGMNRHRVRVPAPRLTNSSREIQARGFAQLKYQLLPAVDQSLFLQQRCGRDAGSAPEHNCRASRGGPFQTSKCGR